MKKALLSLLVFLAAPALLGQVAGGVRAGTYAPPPGTTSSAFGIGLTTDGTETYPSLYWVGERGTGLWHAPSSLRVSIAGVLRAEINASGLAVESVTLNGGAHLLSGGAAGDPSPSIGVPGDFYLEGGAASNKRPWIKTGPTTWAKLAVPSDVPPAGSDTWVQFNDGGTTFGASANMTFAKTTGYLTLSKGVNLGTAGEFFISGSNVYVGNADGAGSLSFVIGDAAKWEIDTGGILVPHTDNTFDLGYSSKTVASGYFGTKVRSPLYQFDGISGISKAGSSIAFGNGTAGDYSASLKFGKALQAGTGEIVVTGSSGGSFVTGENGLHLYYQAGVSNFLSIIPGSAYAPMLFTALNYKFDTSQGQQFRAGTATTADALADVLVATSTTTQKGLVIQGRLGQTANLLEVQNSTGATAFHVDDNSSGRTWSGAFIASQYVQSGNLGIFMRDNSAPLHFGSSDDAGLSRTAAATIALGNGSAGDYSGTLKLSHLFSGTLTTADPLADNYLATSATTQKGLVIQAKASQTAPTFESQASGGGASVQIEPYGSYQRMKLGGNLVSGSTVNTVIEIDPYIHIVGLDNAGIFGWSSAAYNTGSVDTGLSRGGAPATVAVGNGVAGNYSGTLKLSHLFSGTLTTSDSLADNYIGTSASTQKGLVVQGKVSQSGNLTEWQEYSGGVVASMSPYGSLSITNDGGYGIYLNSSNAIRSDAAGFAFISSGFYQKSANVHAWSSTANWYDAADTGLSRGGVATVAVGNGTAGDYSGTLKAGILSVFTAAHAGSNAVISTTPNSGASYFKVFDDASVTFDVDSGTSNQLLRVKWNGTDKFKIGANGDSYLSGDLSYGGSGNNSLGGNGRWGSLYVNHVYSGILTTSDSLADNYIGTSATTQKGVVIQTQNSQTAPGFEIQRSDGTSMFKSALSMPSGYDGVFVDSIQSYTSHPLLVMASSGNTVHLGTNGSTALEVGTGLMVSAFGIQMGTSGNAFGTFYQSKDILSSSATNTAPDANISRTAAATYSFGNGSAGDASGTLQASKFISSTTLTSGNGNFSTWTDLSAANHNLKLGLYFQVADQSYPGIWFNQATPSVANSSLMGDGAYLYLNAPTQSILFETGGTTRATLSSTTLALGGTNLTGTGTANRIGTATTSDSLADNLFATSATTQKALVLQATGASSAAVFEIQRPDGTAAHQFFASSDPNTAKASITSPSLKYAASWGSSGGILGSGGGSVAFFNPADAGSILLAPWVSTTGFGWWPAGGGNSWDLGMYRVAAGSIGFGSAIGTPDARLNYGSSRVGVATTADSLADNLFAASATTQKALVLQEKASQTADIFQAQKSDGTVYASLYGTASYSIPGGMFKINLVKSPSGSLYLNGDTEVRLMTGGGTNLTVTSTGLVGSGGQVFGDPSIPFTKAYLGPAGVSQTASSASYYTALTDSVATSFATLTFGASEAISAELLCRVKVNDATDFQSLTSRIRISSVRKATGNTVSQFNVIGTDTLAESAGGSTLTCTYSLVEGASAVTVKANCASSLTATTFNISFVSESVGPVTIAKV